MNLTSEALAAKTLIKKSFNTNLDQDVSLFEITIRVLGGFLAAFEIDGDKYWIEISQKLGDSLIHAFDTQSGLPVDAVNLKKYIINNQKSHKEN
jgi:mannosyl-oligosaccharide alpha-1,2-mannosidase